MRLLSLCCCLSLAACVDQVTPLGVDDIEDSTGDQLEPDLPKGDVDAVPRPAPTGDKVTADPLDPATTSHRRPVERIPRLNAVPRR